MIVIIFEAYVLAMADFMNNLQKLPNPMLVEILCFLQYFPQIT